MPRSRRTASSLYDDFARHLRELGTSHHWDETTFLLFLNEEKDLMEMQLQDRHEGFSIETWTTDLVAEQSHYQIPTHVARIKRVLRVSDDGSSMVPLLRQEHLSTPTSLDSANTQSKMTYRMIDDYIVIYPTPSSAVTGGLKIEAETATDRMSSGSTLSTSFPMFAETLLVLRCVARAWAQEESEDTTRPLPTFFQRKLAEYEQTFMSYTTTRTFGRIPAVRFHQGA